MTRTASPRNMRWFDPKTHDELELQTLGLIGKDPIWEEDQDNRGAQKYGVDKFEYFRRQDLAQACKNEDTEVTLQWECYNQVMRTGQLASRRTVPPPLSPAPKPVAAQPEPPPPTPPEPVAVQPTPAPVQATPPPAPQLGAVPTPDPELPPRLAPQKNIIFGPRTPEDPDGSGGCREHARDSRTTRRTRSTPWTARLCARATRSARRWPASGAAIAANGAN